MLSCRDIVAMATDHSEGALPPLLRLRIRIHLFLCAACRLFVAQLDETRRLLRQLAGSPTAAEEAELLIRLRR